jgi:excisionase family DNA binding protein
MCMLTTSDDYCILLLLLGCSKVGKEQEMLMTDQKFYTLEEVADMLRVSVETVRRLVLSGEIEAKRVGRQYRISQENLNKYLEKK